MTERPDPAETVYLVDGSDSTASPRRFDPDARTLTAADWPVDVAPLLPANGLAPLKEKAFWLELRAHEEKHKEIRDRTFEAFSERGAYPISSAASTYASARSVAWTKLM